MKLFPEGKKIIAGGAIRAPRGEARAADEGGEDAGEFRGGKRFIGVWEYGDNGDVAPWAILNSTPTTKIPGGRLALNPEGGDLMAGGDGQVSVYHVPEVFKRTK